MDQRKKIKIEEWFMNKTINANPVSDEINDLVKDFVKENEEYTESEVWDVLKGN